MATKKTTRKKKTTQTVKENPLAVNDQVTGIPEGLTPENVSEGDNDLNAEITRNLRVAVSHVRKLREIQKEDLNFYLGDQWTSEERAQLKGENRPCLTFNKIKPMVRLVVGHLIQNAARIEVSPEGQEDEVFSAVMDRILDHIDKISNLNFKLTYLFSGAASAGRAWLEFHQDYNEDPIFGTLKIPYLGPFKIFMDPSGLEYDPSEDCDYGFKVIKLSKSRLKQMFPGKDKEIDEIEADALGNLVDDALIGVEGDANNYGNDPRKPDTGINDVDETDFELLGDLRQVTVAEYWKKVYQDKWFIYFSEDGSIQEYDTEDEAKKALQGRKEITFQQVMADFRDSQVSTVTEEPKIENINVSHVIRKSRVARMHVAIKAGSIILNDDLSLSPFEPFYHGYPFFHATAEWSPESDNPELQIQGLVRSLKDPQREINKARSQYLHILNTSANSGWIGDDDALSEEKWNELQQFGSTPGITIRKKKGSDLIRIHPVEPSLAQSVREKSATDDMKEVSGINADLLSVDTKGTPSGKAIALRIRQAVTILAPAFQNFRYTKQLIGRFLFKIVPTMFDAPKLQRILGPNFMKQHELTPAILKGYLQVIDAGKYDVSISDQGTVDTLREETFESLMEMLQAGVPLPPDIIFDFMNIPNKQEVIKKVEAFQQQQAALEQQKGKGSQ